MSKVFLNEIGTFKPDLKKSYYKNFDKAKCTSTIEEKIEEIKLIFGYLKNDLIKEYLETCNFDTSKTIDLILSKELESNQNSIKCNNKNDFNNISSKEEKIIDDICGIVKDCKSNDEIHKQLCFNLIDNNSHVETEKKLFLDSKSNELCDLRKTCAKLFKHFRDKKKILSDYNIKKEKLNRLNSEIEAMNKEKLNLMILINKYEN